MPHSVCLGCGGISMADKNSTTQEESSSWNSGRFELSRAQEADLNGVGERIYGRVARVGSFGEMDNHQALM